MLDRRPARLLAFALVGVLILGGGIVGWLYHPPYVVFRPGSTLDVSQNVRISGTDSERNQATYLLTTVSTIQPNLFGLIEARLAGEELVPLERVTPPGTTREQFFTQQRDIFRQSRVIAAAAAANASGMEVDINGTGAFVLSILPGSPSDGVLKEGDVITRVNGTPIDLVTDLQERITAEPPGARFDIVVKRAGKRRTVSLRSEELRPEGAPEGTVGIGVIVSTRGFEIDLPFDITFPERHIGGPSAGLAYAIAITDMLQERDYYEGTVAASGTIAPDGDVGPVGGLEHKAIAVDEAGAATFLVPEEQAGTFDAPAGLAVQGVEHLEEALRALERELAAAT